MISADFTYYSLVFRWDSRLSPKSNPASLKLDGSTERPTEQQLANIWGRDSPQSLDNYPIITQNPTERPTESAL